MKKVLPLVILVALLFCGCKVKNYTPEITDFKQNASVVSGDFSYTCEICKKEGVVTVTATSTNASGMCISCDGKTVSFIYDNIILDFDKNKLDYTNPAIAIYDVFNCIQNDNDVKISKTDVGFKYEGKTNLGDFLLVQNKDNTYSSIVYKDANITIEFDT